MCAIVSRLKHTSLYLDESMLSEAARVLGTDGPTSTVRAALEDVVRHSRLESIADWSTNETTQLIDRDVLSRVDTEAWTTPPSDM